MNRDTRKSVFRDEFDHLDYTDMVLVLFKPGYEPRNSSDYYYNTKTKKYYSYYWGSGEPGKWSENVVIERDDIDSPVVAINFCVLF
jgi:hypothetical protein